LLTGFNFLALKPKKRLLLKTIKLLFLGFFFFIQFISKSNPGTKEPPSKSEPSKSGALISIKPSESLSMPELHIS